MNSKTGNNPQHDPGHDPGNDPAIVIGDRPFIDFVDTCERLVARGGTDADICDAVAGQAAALAQHWRMPHRDFRELQPGAPYSSYQLYLNPQRSLSVILDIFAPGQIAPIHNHCCWGVFVCLEGAELERRYQVPVDLDAAPTQTEVVHNGPGAVSTAPPARNAFHQVECLGDEPAVSLHIYGADLKTLQRDRWDEASGRYVRFTSGSDPRRRQASHYLTPQGLALATT